jgi:hypothetical protein
MGIRRREEGDARGMERNVDGLLRLFFVPCGFLQVIEIIVAC